MSASPHTQRRPHRVRRVLVAASLSLVGVVSVLLATVLVAGGIFVPAHYLEPWKAGYAAQFPDPRMEVVAQAMLAPSSHNTQPWIVSLDPADDAVFSLYADADRLTPAVDPLARQAMLSEGTFLQYAAVAGAHLGYSLDVRLFPDGAYNEDDLAASMTTLPVATVTMAKKTADETDASTGAADFASLFLSDTNRDPYTAAPVTEAQQNELLRLAAGTGAVLAFYTSPADVAALGAFGTEGTLIETRYAASTRESNALFFSTEGAKNAARSGFAVEGQGTTGLMKYLLQGMVTLLPSTNSDAVGASRSIASTAAAVRNTEAYAMITTAGNSRVEQVTAGMLYARLSLRARTLGLVVQPLSQVLQEYPSMAAPYAAIRREYAPGGGTIQMLVRVGTPTVQYPPTMRRDAASLLRGP